MEKIVKGLSAYFEKIEGINLKEKEIIFLMFSIPPVCTYRCKKCFTSAGTKKAAKDAMTIEEVFRIIKEGKEAGARNVSILGEGEPLVYKHLKDVVRYIDELGMITMIATNARMLTKDMADFLYKHNVVVGIGLDTLNEKEYVSHCGGNADLKEVLKNISYARGLYSKKIIEKDGYRVYSLLLHMTVTSQSYDQMEKLEDFCKDDIYFDCQSLSKVGNAKKNLALLDSGKGDYKTFKKVGHLIKPPMVLTNLECGKSICSMFYYGLSIALNGDAMFDAHVKESVKYIGNIRNHPLKHLIQKRNHLRDVFLKNYNLVGYCPIRESKSMNQFFKDLDESNIKL